MRRKKYPLTDDALKREMRRLRRAERRKRLVAGTVIIAMAALCAGAYLAQRKYMLVIVRGNSMNNTLASGSVVLCERNVPPERGTLTLFDYEQALLIKRVIALGGDEVIVSEDGVTVNGAALAEDYAIPGGERLGDMEYPLTVPEGGMFVMGDYRAMSVDSRSSTFGVIDSRTSLGRPVFVLWPLFRLGALDR